MTHYRILVALMILLLAPTISFARSSSRVDTSDLDGDIVEEFPIPILFGVTYDDVDPDFGDPRGDGTRTHEGEDMLSPKGTPIVSPTEAVVLSTGSGDSAGNYVYTANPGGEVFRYMHLDEIANISRGDKLDAGDFIGTVGDTGNAPDGVYHLHFEVRKNNEPTDPYPRMTDTFTLKEKMSFLTGIMRDVDDEEEYAQFLVETFKDDFQEALNKGYRLPDEIKDALKSNGISSSADLQSQFDALVDSIPKVLSMELKKGETSSAVFLLQFYLIQRSEGEARDALLAASPTGYYGSITEAAVQEYQKNNKLALTGVYDTETRRAMVN